MEPRRPGLRHAAQHARDQQLADSADEARGVIVEAHDSPLPSIDWRFADERGSDWSPFTDRFPRAAWMQWPEHVPAAPINQEEGETLSDHR
jgi:hypothetical protein